METRQTKINTLVLWMDLQLSLPFLPPFPPLFPSSHPDSATGTVIATRALQVTNGNTNTTVGAVGTVFTNDTIHDLLENTTAQYNSSEDDGNYTFFLLDGSGYIVASTATNHEV